MRAADETEGTSETGLKVLVGRKSLGWEEQVPNIDLGKSDSLSRGDFACRNAESIWAVGRCVRWMLWQILILLYEGEGCPNVPNQYSNRSFPDLQSS